MTIANGRRIVGLRLASWGWRRTRIVQLPSQGIPRETLALDVFMQGNTYSAEEKFPEATTAYHRAQELDPKHAHVAERLAEEVRRHHAVTATAHP